MSPALYAGARTLVQGLVGWLLAHFVVLGQILTAAGVDSSTAVEWVLTSVVLAGYVWLVNWLGSRPGNGWWPKLARGAAKLLMLGLSRTPAYGEPAKTP